jgi:hypothetical protein
MITPVESARARPTDRLIAPEFPFSALWVVAFAVRSGS